MLISNPVYGSTQPADRLLEHTIKCWLTSGLQQFTSPATKTQPGLDLVVTLFTHIVFLVFHHFHHFLHILLAHRTHPAGLFIFHVFGPHHRDFHHRHGFVR